MSTYLVTIRGIAEQGLYIEADSPSEAREKARRADFVDTMDYPDWVRNEEAHTARFWLKRQPVELVES
jgi:hypothetical protein